MRYSGIAGKRAEQQSVVNILSSMSATHTLQQHATQPSSTLSHASTPRANATPLNQLLYVSRMNLCALEPGADSCKSTPSHVQVDSAFFA